MNQLIGHTIEKAQKTIPLEYNIIILLKYIYPIIHFSRFRLLFFGGEKEKNKNFCFMREERREKNTFLFFNFIYAPFLNYNPMLYRVRT
jgi:hypothetical protein